MSGTVASGQKFLCPRCKANSSVIDSRVFSDGGLIRRRRRCLKGHRFSTMEVCLEALPEKAEEISYLVQHAAHRLMAAKLRAMADEYDRPWAANERYVAGQQVD